MFVVLWALHAYLVHVTPELREQGRRELVWAAGGEGRLPEPCDVIRARGRIWDSASYFLFRVPPEQVAALKASILRQFASRPWKIDDADTFSYSILGDSPYWWWAQSLPDADVLYIEDGGSELCFVFSARKGLVYLAVY